MSLASTFVLRVLLTLVAGEPEDGVLEQDIIIVVDFIVIELRESM